MKISNDALLRIYIDKECDPFFGIDQMFIRTPIVFPQVQFELVDIDELNHLADFVRAEEGNAPCFTDDGNQDGEGYYRFFITLYGVWPGCENCITFTYVNGRTGEETERNNYEIELSDEQRLALFMSLNRQCEEEFDESAVDMMAEYANKEGLGWRRMCNA